jgi:hypothetical protein
VKKSFLVFFLIFNLLLPLHLTQAEELPPLPPGPLILTSVTPDMLSPDYWISRIENPDKVLKTPKELKSFNEDIRAMVKDQVDVFLLQPTRSGKPVKEIIQLQYNALRGRGLYDVNDAVVPKSFFDTNVKPVINIGKIPERITLKWGAATRATSVRALPTDVKLLEKLQDVEFDQLQFTQIKLWTPVAILHTSSDGKWYFIQAPYTRGWVHAKDIALFSSRDALKKYAKSDSFLVVTGESVPLYADAALASLHQRPSMGTLLPYLGKTASVYKVSLPTRGTNGKVLIRTGYLDLGADVSKGFPAFTQRNIIRQAFKLLGARYGWGGSYNGRDCSGFTHDIFLSMGVDMPRGSKGQAFVGTQLGHFEYKDMAGDKLAVLQQAVPGLTLIRMPSHQMLFLGEVNGNYYAIHSTWAERYSMTSDAKNRINQVVVSDLNLNGKSHLGSLFDRIITISEIN